MHSLTAIVSLVIASFENSVNDEIRDQTENVTFLCQAVGEPVPDISWYFNGVMINVPDNSSKYMIMSRSLNITTTENTLTVYNVTSSDVGTYTCNSSNIIGSVTSSGILTVTSKLTLHISVAIKIVTTYEIICMLYQIFIMSKIVFNFVIQNYTYLRSYTQKLSMHSISTVQCEMACFSEGHFVLAPIDATYSQGLLIKSDRLLRWPAIGSRLLSIN